MPKYPKHQCPLCYDMGLKRIGPGVYQGCDCRVTYKTKEPNVTNQKQLDLSKPCVTEPGGVPCRFGSSSYSGEILIWNLLREGYCDIKHYTDLHGNPLIFGFPRVVNVPEPDPLEKLRGTDLLEAVNLRFLTEYGEHYDWNGTESYLNDERLILTCYRVVAAKLAELKAKERTK